MEVNSNPLRIPPFTPSWLFSDAYIKHLIERWTNANGLEWSTPPPSHKPACVRWAILTALTGEWYRGASVKGIKIQDWRGSDLASTWAKENNPGLRSSQDRVRNARVLAAVDIAPAAYRKGNNRAYDLLGVDGATMATRIASGKQLPLKSAEAASKGLFCNVRWLSGAPDLATNSGISILTSKALRRILDLEGHLPETMASAPTWLHPYLMWWHQHESRNHIDPESLRSYDNNVTIRASIEGLRGITLSHPLWIGVRTPPPGWMRKK